MRSCEQYARVPKALQSHPNPKHLVDYQVRGARHGLWGRLSAPDDRVESDVRGDWGDARGCGKGQNDSVRDVRSTPGGQCSVFFDAPHHIFSCTFTHLYVIIRISLSRAVIRIIIYIPPSIPSCFPFSPCVSLDSSPFEPISE